MPETKSDKRILSVRLELVDIEALGRVARLERRKVADMMRVLILEGIEQRLQEVHRG